MAKTSDQKSWKGIWKRRLNYRAKLNTPLKIDFTRSFFSELNIIFKKLRFDVKKYINLTFGRSSASKNKKMGDAQPLQQFHINPYKKPSQRLISFLCCQQKNNQYQDNNKSSSHCFPSFRKFDRNRRYIISLIS